MASLGAVFARHQGMAAKIEARRTNLVVFVCPSAQKIEYTLSWFDDARIIIFAKCDRCPPSMPVRLDWRVCLRLAGT